MASIRKHRDKWQVERQLLLRHALLKKATHILADDDPG
jgi:hypothetical protein